MISPLQTNRPASPALAGTSLHSPAKVGANITVPAHIAPDHAFTVKVSREQSAPTNANGSLARQVAAQIKEDADPALFGAQVKQIVDHIRNNALEADNDGDMSVLQAFATRLAKEDKVYATALLVDASLLANQDAELKDAGYDSDSIFKRFIKDKEHDLRAFINIRDVLKQHADLAKPNELLRAYQDILVASQSTLSALSAIITRLGAGGLPQWQSFLSKAAVADLCALEGGADKVHLLFVLSELKSFRILNTFSAFLKKVSQTRLNMAQIPFDDLLSTSLEFVAQPLATMSSIEKWILSCTHSEQILFLQDYRNLFSSISTDAYKNEQEQQNVKSVLQKRIDHLVYTEEG